MTAWLSAFFGGLALLLSSIGLYGLMSYAVNRRTPEIGVRIALGAQRANVIGMVLREVLLLVGIGVATGIPVALLASKWVAAMLFGLAPTDPQTASVAAAVLLAIALFAGYLPPVTRHGLIPWRHCGQSERQFACTLPGMAKITEKKRDHISEGEFAFPDERKEPIHDAAHVRNAVARFNQVKGVSDAERDAAWKRIKSAAKKYGVELEEKDWRELKGS